MREATGELNMTVIVVIAVAGLVAFFSMFVFPNFTKTVGNQQNCSNAVCEKKGEGSKCTGSYVECHDPGEKDSSKYYCCPYKG